MFCLLAFTDFGGYLVCLSQCWYENAALSVLFSMLKYLSVCFMLVLGGIPVHTEYRFLFFL